MQRKRQNLSARRRGEQLRARRSRRLSQTMAARRDLGTTQPESALTRSTRPSDPGYAYLTQPHD
jgi:hypothetical protein